MSLEVRGNVFGGCGRLSKVFDDFHRFRMSHRITGVSAMRRDLRPNVLRPHVGGLQWEVLERVRMLWKRFLILCKVF